MTRISFFAVALVIVAFAACTTSPPSNTENSDSSPVPGPSVETQEVVYDHVRPETPPAIKAQVLVDASASMLGFKSSFARILHALDEGLSYSRGLYFHVESKRTCAFNEKQTIFACQTRIDGAILPPALGYTNLDQAIKQAAAYDLTVILTDGVPSGHSGRADCVGSGVDAACVAEALAAVVQAKPNTPPTARRGLWLIPIVTPYAGRYFAEQTIDPKEFNVDAALKSVSTGLGVNAGIQNPRTGSDGTLQFDYNGPRILLAMVIGDTSVARAFIQEFMVRSEEFSGIQILPEIGRYRGGTALSKAVEVFPSVVPPQNYHNCAQQLDARGRVQGDLINCEVIDANRMRLSCRPKPSSSTLLLSSDDSVHALHLRLLAPVKLSFDGHNRAAQVRPLPSGDSASRSLSKILVQLNCDASKPVQCGKPEARVTLSSSADTRQAASDIADPSSRTGAYVVSLSTSTPALDPYRIYGLADLLENFYRRALPNTLSSFAPLEFCEK